MKRRLSVLVGMSLLIGVESVQGQILGTGVTPVMEIGGQLVQSTITAANSVTTAINVAASYVRQGEQLINEFNQIRIAINQYETMIKNLKRLPEGLNFVDTVLAAGNKLTGLLNQANALSYDLDSSTRQFEQLYVEAGTVALGDLRPVKERFLSARMQASGVSVQVQSVRANMSDMFTRICALLNGSWSQAEGNFDAQQITHQQNALTLQTLQQLQALQATAARLQSQREAEEVALARLKQRVQDEFTRSLPEYTDEAGTLPTWGWVTTSGN